MTSARPLKLLLASEFYHPSRGGVQEVMRQIAERLAAAGHDVTVATSHLPERTFSELNGVKIAEFRISGKAATGIAGETERYVDFLRRFDGDAVMIKAAQQWTFDAAWPALDDIKARKVFIPCGFSCLYEPDFAQYFAALPAILAKFDDLIFYAESYRDVDFARRHGLERLIRFLPNGASESEFADPDPGDIRRRLGVPDEALLVMTVGTPIGAKGHTELAEAFGLLPSSGRPLALLLNGQWPEQPPRTSPEATASLQLHGAERRGFSGRPAGLAARGVRTLTTQGLGAFARRTAAVLAFRGGRFLRRGLGVAGGWLSFLRMRKREPGGSSAKPIEHHIATARSQPDKFVVMSNLDRPDLIKAYFAADLFVFASNVEYSPLVLFEAAAAGLPFLTVPVGNAEEIVRWTGGGEICPAPRDERGYTRVDPQVLAAGMRTLLEDPARRDALAAAGREAWRAHYNWAMIVGRYEEILQGLGRSSWPSRP
jgi:glycosyltransferase involved in cell wall biosynthesis